MEVHGLAQVGFGDWPCMLLLLSLALQCPRAEPRVSLLYPDTDGASGPTEGPAEADQQGKQGKHGQGKMAQLEGTWTTAMGQGCPRQGWNTFPPSLPHSLLPSVSIGWDPFKLPKTTGLPLYLKK